MKMIRNIQINSHRHDKPMLADCFYVDDGTQKPLIIFSHGFKGFKDWGHWDLIAEYFANAGFFYVKFNFSHNGTSVNDPSAFGDLEAFSQNNYSLEVSDLDSIISFLLSPDFEQSQQIDQNRLALIGHSKGGAVSLIKASSDKRVKAIVAWAPIYDIGSRWPADMLKQWKAEGTYFVANARTGQQMPMDYQIVQDYLDNQEALDVPKAIRDMDKPILVVHGDQDEAISYGEAMTASLWNQAMKFETISGAGHTFGGTHPMKGSSLSAHSQQLVNKTNHFLQQVFGK
ncbi:MAG: alpha/beta fold hydrolase [Bacteroidota bacterium]